MYSFLTVIPGTGLKLCFEAWILKLSFRKRVRVSPQYVEVGTTVIL